jgi:hypothetical protein
MILQIGLANSKRPSTSYGAGGIICLTQAVYDIMIICYRVVSVRLLTIAIKEPKAPFTCRRRGSEADERSHPSIIIYNHDSASNMLIYLAQSPSTC